MLRARARSGAALFVSSWSSCESSAASRRSRRARTGEAA
jgi:hypothetical protein